MVAVIEQVFVAFVSGLQLMRDALEAFPHRVVNPIGQPSAVRVGLLGTAIPIVHQMQAAISVGEERPNNLGMPMAPCPPDLLFAVVNLLGS
jgi:hypothetical protein